jgi:hypothetical protein
MNDNCKKIEVIDRLAQTNNNDLINTNNSFLFIYDTKQINITGTLNKCYDTYINTLPKLENKYNIDFEFDSTVDLVDILLTRQVDLGRQVIYNYNKPVCPAIYNFSIVTNSYVNVKINGRDYVINSQAPMHILFHNFKNILELEVSFYYEKVSQIVRFMMAEPN